MRRTAGALYLHKDKAFKNSSLHTYGKSNLPHAAHRRQSPGIRSRNDPGQNPLPRRFRRQMGGAVQPSVGLHTDLHLGIRAFRRHAERIRSPELPAGGTLGRHKPQPHSLDEVDPRQNRIQGTQKRRTELPAHRRHVDGRSAQIRHDPTGRLDDGRRARRLLHRPQSHDPRRDLLSDAAGPQLRRTQAGAGRSANHRQTPSGPAGRLAPGRRHHRTGSGDLQPTGAGSTRHEMLRMVFLHQAAADGKNQGGRLRRSVTAFHTIAPADRPGQLYILKKHKQKIGALQILRHSDFFERKTMPHPHFEVAVYQSHCKRTIPLYHALVMREERRIAQLFQEPFNI